MDIRFKILILILIVVGIFTVGFNNQIFHGVAQDELPIFVKEAKILKAPQSLYVPDEIIIKFKSGVNEDAIRGLEQAQGVLEKYISPFAKFRVLKIPQGKLVTEMVEIFKRSPLVEYAEPNYYAYATMVPNDPGYQYQWHLDNSVYGGVQMEQAWDIITGTQSVIVAVVDTGVAYEDYPAPPHWHIDTYNAYGSSGYSWWCGMFNSEWPNSPGYGNGWKDYLQHSFDLTAATGTVTLTYQRKYDTERNYDYAYVEVSDNSGLSWTQFKSYTGSAGWKQDSINLTSYKNKTILVRFRFNSDESVSDEDGHLYTPKFNSDGAIYIDEIKLVDGSGNLFYDNVESGAGIWETTKYQKAPDLVGTSFAAGYDFINNDNHPNDDESHGTHVAGTIAQATNNNLGVAGVAFNTTLMPVKVLDAAGSGSYQQVADGIYYAVNNGAKVINMSLGGTASATILEDAVKYAYDNGVTVIAACGNSNASSCDYPAAYNAYVIAVGATQYNETRAPYSNYGSSLDLVAPGGNTSVDQNSDGYPDGVLQNTFGDTPVDFAYWFFQGTSMSTPHVVGVAALLLAQNPSRTPTQIRDILQSTAEDKGTSGWDQYYGYGIVDAYAALTFGPVVSITVTSNSTFDYGTLALSPGAGNPNKKSTIDLNKTPVIKNTGNVAVDLTAKSSDATGGTTPWNLVIASSIGQDMYCHQYSTTSGSAWYDFPISNDYTGIIKGGLSVNNTTNLDLQILMPTGSTDNVQKSITITIRATQAP